MEADDGESKLNYKLSEIVSKPKLVPNQQKDPGIRWKVVTSHFANLQENNR